MKIFLITLFLFLISFYGCNSSILDDPSTTIGYTIPERSHVKITVENSYKTVIATLVDKEQFAGKYTVNLEMSNLAEGVYFYTIELKGLVSDFYSKTTSIKVLVK